MTENLMEVRVEALSANGWLADRISSARFGVLLQQLSVQDKPVAGLLHPTYCGVRASLTRRRWRSSSVTAEDAS